MGTTNTNSILPSDAVRVEIPFSLARERFGNHMADIMDKLAASKAADAKGKPANAFKWSLDYVKAPDPDTPDPDEFAATLGAESEIYLVARGWKWKGWSRLNSVPPQIAAKFTDRARMICGMRAAAADEPLVVVSPAETTDRDVIDALNSYIQDRVVDQRVLRICRIALEQLFQSAE